MSHVDKGALHAYLDGALDEYPSGEARRVREHLDACAECAQQLEEERLLREGTRELLAMAAPSVEAPPLEELRSLARSGSGLGDRRPRLKLYRLSWAASVVLALGAGWMLRGQQGVMVQADLQSPSVLEERESFGAQSTAERQAADAEIAASSDGTSADARIEQNSVRDAGLTRSFAEAPAAEPVPVEVDVVAAAADVAQDLDFADALASRPPELQAPAEEALTDLVAVRDEVTVGSALEARLDQPAVIEGVEGGASKLSREAQPTQLRSEIQAGVGAGAIAADLVAAPTASAPGRRRENGEMSDAGSLSVSGLEVIEVTFLDDGVAPTGVRILQRLASGDTLELIHLPDGVDPASVAGAAVQVEELRVSRGAGWLIMRAPVARVRLEELLVRLDSIP